MVVWGRTVTRHLFPALEGPASTSTAMTDGSTDQLGKQNLQLWSTWSIYFYNAFLSSFGILLKEKNLCDLNVTDFQNKIPILYTTFLTDV